MCIIVDANAANELAANSVDAKPVMGMIVSKKLTLVVGGKLKAELMKTRLRRLYQQFQLAGALVEFDDDATDNEEQKLDANALKSNDLHVIALARISGARILFSHDGDLHEDFKNRTLVPGDKGKVYQSSAHQRVLREGKCACAIKR